MKKSIEKYVRENIRQLKAYQSARTEFSGEASVFLDANENPYPTEANRYPDPLQKALKKKIAELKDINPENLFLGNGSDEAIDLVMRIFAEPGRDAVLQFSPTYGMYSVLAQINNLQVIDVPLDEAFQPDLKAYTNAIVQNQNIKLIFLCSPNNPTANLMDKQAVKSIVDNFNGIVVLDEAYIDFSGDKGFLNELLNYPNLIILQTLSKAYGLAGLRVGLAAASEEIIHLMNKVKYPYNMSALNQKQALEQLSKNETQNQVAEIIAERDKLAAFLNTLDWVEKVYPSDANFLFFTTNIDAALIYNYLNKNGIIIRNRQSQYKNALRITVGTTAENELLISKLISY
jgi:histidinol-phosphate aminotransferase